MYFAALMILNLLQLLLMGQSNVCLLLNMYASALTTLNRTDSQHGPFWNFISYYSAPLTSILTCRFLLHLRHVDTASYNEFTFQSHLSFANGPHIGNIGAPLTYSRADASAESEMIGVHTRESSE